jgi:pyruvate dehydrogenase E2 component (dihydrolipoamide acetyltransferase)
MRRAIAQRTQASKSQIPHFYASTTIDMEAARVFLEDVVEFARLNEWQPPTFNDIILRAAALSLRATPQINASLVQDSILFHAEINIGLVVGLDEGMIIPVVHRADEKNLYTLAALTDRLKDRARNLSLSGSELIGSTFTLSNLGMYRLDSFIAVINPPEAGVLAVGAVRQVPAVWENQVVPRWQMQAVLSVDHRIVDGAVAAKFMDDFKRRLEKPVGLALEAPQEAE